MQDAASIRFLIGAEEFVWQAETLDQPVHDKRFELGASGRRGPCEPDAVDGIGYHVT